jgi:hypothetical protein
MGGAMVQTGEISVRAVESRWTRDVMGNENVEQRNIKRGKPKEVKMKVKREEN